MQIAVKETSGTFRKSKVKSHFGTLFLKKKLQTKASSKYLVNILYVHVFDIFVARVGEKLFIICNVNVLNTCNSIQFNLFPKFYNLSEYCNCYL